MSAVDIRKPIFFTRPMSVAAGGALVLSALVDPNALPSVSLCGFRALTGAPCPGCGLTHAFCAIGHGRFAEAWHYHPFGFLFYVIAALIVFGPLLYRLDPKCEERLARALVTYCLGPALICALVVFGFLRMWTG